MDDPVTTYTDGLRAVADFLDAHPNLIRSWDHQVVNLFPNDEVERAEMIRALTDGAAKGTVAKEVQGTYLSVVRRFGPHTIEINMKRDEVCEAVQVGTRTVTHPDPDALAAVPTVEVEEPIIEWRCRPLLEVS